MNIYNQLYWGGVGGWGMWKPEDGTPTICLVEPLLQVPL